MEIGKVPGSVLKEIILNKLKVKRSEILLRPEIGEDCCAVEFGEYACVLSTDPITGALNEIGRLAVNVCCNDVAACGVEPLGMLVTILAPAGTVEKDLDVIMKQMSDAANSLNIDIIGGHTEITESVNRFIIIGTAVGKIIKSKLITTSGAKPGEKVILTKFAGIEGTAVIARDKEEDLLRHIDRETVENAKNLIEYISVVKEGLIAGEFGVSAMHDITEGGVLGAVWEMSEASEVGVKIYRNNIPIINETLEICRIYDINPLKLISSGCMLIACEDGEGLIQKLKDNNITAAIIGEFTENPSKLLIGDSGDEVIQQPESDELYKVL